MVGVLFVDFSKAFDSVDHDILKQKMIAAGITGGLYNLIESYLDRRKQYVEMVGAH